MIKKIVKLHDKNIQVYERKGMFGTLVIHEQKLKFDQDCKTVLTLFAKFAKVNKLPANAQDVVEAIAQSYKNCENSFTTRKPFAVVVDTDRLIDELIK